jgi:Ca2+/Na+ antiporter
MHMNTTKFFEAIKTYRRYVLLAAIDCAFFGLVSPDSNAFVIIPAFILVMLSIFAILTLIVGYVGKMFVVKPSNQRRIVLMLTASIAAIIALQSVGQLTVRDVATIVPLILVLYLYVSYTKSRRA